MDGTHDDRVAIARRIATAAHEGQTDKLGAPYIQHPERVAARVAATTDDAAAIAAAWLHDVVEDSDVTLNDLAAAGIAPDAVRAVDLLTRRGDVDAATYYDRIRADRVARQVKLADLADNTDPRRLALLDEATQLRLIAKYAAALHAIEGTTPPEPVRDTAPMP